MDEPQVNPAAQDDTQNPATAAPEGTEGEVVTETPAETPADTTTPEETQA